MRTYKNLTALLLCLLLALGLFAGCAGGEPSPEAEKLRVVVTIFPEYDWVREILGERQAEVELTLLMDSGADLHSYQPTPKDMAVISKCDLFICTGGISDKWVTDVLAQADSRPEVLNLIQALGSRAKEEELAEGMEAEEEAEDDAEHRHSTVEYDEHIWLSVQNAAFLCDVIRDRLCSLDPEGAAVYTANAAAYAEKLSDLDARYREAVEDAEFTTLLFADRFPFRYLTDDYGLRYYAAFLGCSAETEASFETIAFLSSKVDELGLRSILQIESANGSVARTVRDNTAGKDQQILTMDSMQSVTPADVSAGVTYLGVMEQNLEVLKQALH